MMDDKGMAPLLALGAQVACVAQATREEAARVVQRAAAAARSQSVRVQHRYARTRVAGHRSDLSTAYYASGVAAAIAHKRSSGVHCLRSGYVGWRSCMAANVAVAPLGATSNAIEGPEAAAWALARRAAGVGRLAPAITRVARAARRLVAAEPPVRAAAFWAAFAARDHLVQHAAVALRLMRKHADAARVAADRWRTVPDLTRPSEMEAYERCAWAALASAAARAACDGFVPLARACERVACALIAAKYRAYGPQPGTGATARAVREATRAAESEAAAGSKALVAAAEAARDASRRMRERERIHQLQQQQQQRAGKLRAGKTPAAQGTQRRQVVPTVRIVKLDSEIEKPKPMEEKTPAEVNATVESLIIDPSVAQTNSDTGGSAIDTEAVQTSQEEGTVVLASPSQSPPTSPPPISTPRKLLRRKITASDAGRDSRNSDASRSTGSPSFTGGTQAIENKTAQRTTRNQTCEMARPSVELKGPVTRSQSSQSERSASTSSAAHLNMSATDDSLPTKRRRTSSTRR